MSCDVVGSGVVEDGVDGGGGVTGKEGMSDVDIVKSLDVLEASGINFLALDFDLTVLSIHTGGNWQGTAEELLPLVRPVFLDLVAEALKRGMCVAIVTFSPQVCVVREVVRLCWPRHCDSMPIRGGDRTWSYEGAGSKAGKQGHMASAVEELLAQDPNREITRASTLLVDDDANNVNTALKEGVRAIWLNPDEPDSLLPNILELLGT